MAETETREYVNLERAVKNVQQRVKHLKGKEEFAEFGRIIDGMEKKCIATLIEDFYWGD